MDELNSTIQQPTEYNDDDIKTLDWMEHIRGVPVCISENWGTVAMPMMVSMCC